MASYIVFETLDKDVAADKQTNTFTCPCCQSVLEFLVRTDIIAVRPVSTADGTPISLKIGEEPVTLSPEEVERARKEGRIDESGNLIEGDDIKVPVSSGLKTAAAPPDAKGAPDFSDDEREILAAADNSGVLKAFRDAVEILQGPKPKNIERFFLRFLKDATKREINQKAMRLLLKKASKKESSTDELELWGFQKIFAVSRNRELKMFLPTEFVHGEVIERSELKHGKVQNEIITVDDWLKTGSGYIQSGGSDFAAFLSTKTYGALSGT